MTQPVNNPWDLGGGGESFPFDNIGDEVEGFVQEMIERQGTDMQTGKLDWWDEEHTRPKMLTILVLQTALRTTPNDDGMRSITLSGSKKPETRSRMAAAVGAVKAATGGTQMEPNAWFKMKYIGDGPKTKPGFNAPKYYEAWYRPPVMDLDGASQTAPVNQVAQGYAPQDVPAQQQLPATNVAPAQSPNGGAAITVAQVEGLKAAGVDPALVYGADWHTRVVP